MKEDLFLSREAFRRRQNEIRNRQERLIQVREQSRRMAAAVVARMKEDAAKQYQEIESRILSEIREYYSRELSAVRQQYDECISEINQQHYIKQVELTEQNKPVITRRKSAIPKKSFQETSDKNTETSTIDSKKEIGSKKKPEIVTKEKKNIKMSSATNPSSSISIKKCNIPKHMSKNDAGIRPENTAIDSEADNDDLMYYHPPHTSASPNLRHGILKKSVVYHNKENCQIIKNTNLRVTTKPANKITNGMLNSDVVHPEVDQINSNDLYNQLVHDRIRVLEQKEKILSRRIPSPLAISNLTFPRKPARFTEYFHNFRSQTTVHPKNVTQGCKSDDSPKKCGITEVEKDLTRVQLKKKLLVLELSNAETQTEKINSTNAVESNQHTDSPIRSLSSDNADKETSASIPSYNANTIAEAESTKALCPTSIAKETESSEDKPRNDVDVKPKKNCKCRRKQLRKCDDVIVTVSNNKTKVITNSSDTNSSTLALNYISPHSSVENDFVPTDSFNSHKTVKVIVNVLSNNECKKNRRKLPEKQKNVAYVKRDDNFRKTSNWKNIFENDERLTESSYFSPPEMGLKSVKFSTKSVVESDGDKYPETKKMENPAPDIGYYVAKLLMMSPESVENLTVSSNNSTIVSEYDDQPMEKKAALNVPLYQNSLNETLETFAEPVNGRKQNEYAQDNSVTTTGIDESVDISFSAYLKKNVSSLSGSSSSETVESSNISHASSPKNKSQDDKDLMKTSDHTDPKNILGTKSAEENVVDGFDEEFTLPSLEELRKRGFGWKLMTNRSSTDEMDLKDEDIVEELLKVRFPSNKEKTSVNSSKSCVEKMTQTVPVLNIENRDVTSTDEVDSVVPESKSADVKEFQKQPILRGWMGTTLKRTLEASAVTSTSSGDSGDTIRKMLTTFEKPFEGISELILQSESTSSNRKSSLSPLKVPDLRLSIPFDFKNTL